MQGLKAGQILELMNKIPFFNRFSLKERKELATVHCNVIRYDNGDTIIKQGDVEYSLYILLSGSVKVTREVPRDASNRKFKEVVLTKLEAGSVFGEISLLAQRPRSTSAFAEGQAIVARLDGQILEIMDPSLQNKIQRQLIDLLIFRLEDMNQQIIDLTRS